MRGCGVFEDVETDENEKEKGLGDGRAISGEDCILVSENLAQSHRILT